MPFPAHSFNRIIAVDAYHHFAHQQASLVELWRLLSPGGWLVIEEPDIRNFNVKLIALGEKITLFRSHFVHAEHIAAQLENLGAHTEIQRGDFNYWVSAFKPSA
jgi:ubiquinone/menaquinone biosynthesis C-methylase UbiE